MHARAETRGTPLVWYFRLVIRFSCAPV